MLYQKALPGLRLNSLKYLQHFDVHNSNEKKGKKEKKIFSSQLFGTHARLRKIQVATVTNDFIQLRQGI